MGPRRVGKTVVVFHFIKRCIDDGVQPRHLIYLDLQQPLFNGLSLEKLLDLAILAAKVILGFNIIRGKEQFYDFSATDAN